MRRVLACLISIAMALALMPAIAFAQSTSPTSGTKTNSASAKLAISNTVTGTMSGGYKAEITVPTDADGKPFQTYRVTFTSAEYPFYSFVVPASTEGGSFTDRITDYSIYADSIQYTVNDGATAKQVENDLSNITYYNAGTVTVSAVKLAPADGDIYYNGHYYSLSSERTTWQSAMSTMLAGDTQKYSGYKGHPVTVTSASENAALKMLYSGGGSIWLGAVTDTATKDNSYTEGVLNECPGGDGTVSVLNKGTGYKWIWGTPEGDQADQTKNVLPDGSSYWHPSEPNCGRDGYADKNGYTVFIGLGGSYWDDLCQDDTISGGFSTSCSLTEYSPITSDGAWLYDEDGNSATVGFDNVQSASQTFSEDSVRHDLYVSSSGTTAATGTKEDPFATIAEAYNAAGTTGVYFINLMSDIEQNSPIEMNASKKVVIASDSTASDNNTFAIKRTETSPASMFSVKTGELTLTNVTLDGGSVTNSGQAICVEENATLNLQDGSTIKIFVTSTDFLGIVANSGTLNMSGTATITGNTAVVGSGVLNSGTFNMSGGNITNNEAAGTMNMGGQGGGVLNSISGTLNMSGTATITGNIAESGGGVCNVGTVNMSGNINITENTKADKTTKDNFYFYENNSITVTDAGMGTDASVGISVKTPQDSLVVVNGATDTKIFTSDAAGYHIVAKDDTLVLAAHDLQHVDAKAATAAVAGNIEYWYCSGCDRYFSDEAAETEIQQADTVIAKLAPSIISGDGVNVVQGEQKALAFISDAAFEDFDHVDLDGGTLPKYYTVTSDGGIKITLDAGLVAALTLGEHVVSIFSESGVATAKFIVKEADAKTDFVIGNFKYIIQKDGKSVYIKAHSKKVKKLAIPATVKDTSGNTYKVVGIAKKGFKNCKKLKKVSGGANIKIVCAKAFSGCKKLKKVTVSGKSLKTIGAKAFSGCKVLKKATFKSKVLKKIGKSAFAKTKKLTKITIKKTTKLKTVKKAFKRAGKKGGKKLTIKVKASKKKAYKKLILKKGGNKKLKVK